jgi:hypothetical protein
VVFPKPQAELQHVDFRQFITPGRDVLLAAQLIRA